MGVIRMFKVAIAQLTSSSDLDANLKRMREIAETAAKQGAKVLAFPEMASFMGRVAEWRGVLNRYEEQLDLFGQWAKELGMFLLPGTLREPVRGDKDRYFNTLALIGPQGKVVAKYRKIFLFKAKLPDRDYDESEHCEAGQLVVTVEASGAVLGLGVCYDLRFPELFRALKEKGAQIIFLPSAFTVPTGEAHWHTLIRARAIENQVFVVAPAQTGKLGDGRDTYGHSLVVAPWGEIVADLGIAQTLRVVDLDVAAIEAAAKRVDCWGSRRAELFPTETLAKPGRIN